MQNDIYIIFIQFIIHGYKIVNGIIGHNIRSASANEYRSVVCVVRYDAGVSWQEKMSCTGTLISNNFILTAAHCFHDANYTQYEISMGSHLVELGERYYPVWWITYDQWATMNIPYHVSIGLVDDIMLVKIFGVWHDIFPTPMHAMSPPSLMYGLDADLVGCGKRDNGYFPEIMQVATVKIIDLNLCSQIVSELDGTYLNFTNKYSCSIGYPYTQLYYGDSGGPLIYFGVVIAINIAVCPVLNNEFHPSKVNIHVNLERYEGFFHDIVIDGY